MSWIIALMVGSLVELITDSDWERGDSGVKRNLSVLLLRYIELVEWKSRFDTATPVFQSYVIQNRLNVFKLYTSAL